MRQRSNAGFPPDCLYAARPSFGSSVMAGRGETIFADVESTEVRSVTLVDATDLAPRQIMPMGPPGAAPERSAAPTSHAARSRPAGDGDGPELPLDEHKLAELHRALGLDAPRQEAVDPAASNPHKDAFQLQLEVHRELEPGDRHVILEDVDVRVVLRLDGLVQEHSAAGG